MTLGSTTQLRGLALLAPALSAGLLLLAPAPARAWQWPTLTVPKTEPTWSVAFRISPYRPRIAAPGDPAVTSFEVQFARGLGDDFISRGPILKTLEVDYYFMNNFGRLGVTAAVGHWNIDGRAQRCFTNADHSTDENDTPPSYAIPTECTKAMVTSGYSYPGNTHESLTVVPVSLSAVYRADQLMMWWNIPLMPYARFGLDYHFWWLRAGPNIKGDGGTFGWHATAGLALNLNWLDPSDPAGDSLLGIIAGHFFAEITYIGADQFGASPNQRLDLSDLTGSLGVALDLK